MDSVTLVLRNASDAPRWFEVSRVGVLHSHMLPPRATETVVARALNDVVLPVDHLADLIVESVLQQGVERLPFGPMRASAYVLALRRGLLLDSPRTPRVPTPAPKQVWRHRVYHPERKLIIERIEADGTVRFRPDAWGAAASVNILVLARSPAWEYLGEDLGEDAWAELAMISHANHAGPPAPLAPEPSRPIDHAALRDKSGVLESLGRALDEGIAEHRRRADEARRRGPDFYEDDAFLRAERAAYLVAKGPPPQPYVPQKLSRFDALALRKARQGLEEAGPRRLEVIARAFPQPTLAECFPLKAAPSEPAPEAQAPQVPEFGQLYILDGHTPVRVENALAWGAWFASKTTERQVASTELGEVRVSTIFLGLAHFGGMLFETMVFGGECDGDVERYLTWEQAEKGHARTVGRVRWNQSPPTTPRRELETRSAPHA